jgi:mannose-6-phosphate isomerase-like protein (cupin superfamily)
MKEGTCLAVILLPLVLFLGGAHMAGFPRGARTPSDVPHQKVVKLDSQERKELRILGGTPESYRMRAGLVVLAPGDSVGRHSTQQNEELLVVLEGSGEMIFGDGSKLPVRANTALYCPPETTHDVVNTGRKALRYVYVVSQAK